PDEAVLVLQEPPTSDGGPPGNRPRSKVETRETRVVRMRMIGSNPTPNLVGLEPLPGRSNYLVGNDPRRWRTGVTRYARVEYESVYPGIDLVFRGSDSRLEYDLIAAPGADPGVIRIGFQGTE